MSEVQTIIKATGVVRHCALCSTLQGVLLFSFTICEIVPCSVLSASDKRVDEFAATRWRSVLRSHCSKVFMFVLTAVQCALHCSQHSRITSYCLISQRTVHCSSAPAPRPSALCTPTANTAASTLETATD